VSKRIGLCDELDTVTEYWSQHLVAEANGNLFNVAKGAGTTSSHSNSGQDESFALLDGALTVQMRDRDVELRPGDLFVVPITGPSVTSNAGGGKPEGSYADDAR
jgi:mannose-6-phosphate isomerase-like protein (cupin superfamily)